MADFDTKHIFAIILLLLMPVLIFVLALFFASEFRSDELALRREKELTARFMTRPYLTDKEIEFLRERKFNDLLSTLRLLYYEDKGMAYELYAKAIEMGVESQEAYETLAELHENRNEKLEAIALYTKAISLDPKAKKYGTRSIFGRLARLYQEVGNYNKAAIYYEKYLTFYSNNVEGRYHLAVCYYRLERLEDALNQLNRCIRIDPGSPHISNVHNLMGLVYEEQGFLNAAEENYLKALRLSPTNADAKANLERLRKIKEKAKL